MKNISDKPILLLQNKIDHKKINYNEKISLPTSFNDLKNKIKKIIAGYKFLYNSTVKIKKYLLDKNEKKLIKDNTYIFITVIEVQLIELLFSEK